MNEFDLATTQGCVAFIVDRRAACRRIIRLLDEGYDMNRQNRRLAKKFRETNKPMLIRRAETLEADASRRSAAMKVGEDLLREFGGYLMSRGREIDAFIPQAKLLDILNVNVADRCNVEPDDGIVEIAYIKGLEDSAMYRGEDWKRGPLAQAVMRFMNHELIHNEQLQQAAHENLFGKGGMFEFLPMYKTNGTGDMVRMPPKLRLAEACDSNSDAA